FRARSSEARRGGPPSAADVRPKTSKPRGSASVRTTPEAPSSRSSPLGADGPQPKPDLPAWIASPNPQYFGQGRAGQSFGIALCDEPTGARGRTPVQRDERGHGV